MIAALYIDALGPYGRMAGVDPWPEWRDAREYDGPDPVVAHPPCGPWGKLRHQYEGDEHDCAPRALTQVREHGGLRRAHDTLGRRANALGIGLEDRSAWRRAAVDEGLLCCATSTHAAEVGAVACRRRRDREEKMRSIPTKRQSALADIFERATILQISMRQLDVLRDLAERAPDWVRPMDVGGRDQSHHARTLQQLVALQLVETKKIHSIFCNGKPCCCRGGRRYRVRA